MTGLPSLHFSYVQNVDSGLPLFLFNYSDRKLYGVYEAAGPGQMYIDQYAWSSDGSIRTPYPAQVPNLSFLFGIFALVNASGLVQKTQSLLLLYEGSNTCTSALSTAARKSV